MIFVNALVHSGMHTVVFSSTAAVYGDPLNTPINEAHPKIPINSYGDTKLHFEGFLRGQEK